MADTRHSRIPPRPGRQCGGRKAVGVYQSRSQFADDSSQTGAQLIERQPFAVLVVSRPVDVGHTTFGQSLSQRPVGRRGDVNIESGRSDRRQRGEHRSLAAKQRRIFAED